ncbi:MAG: hypothetical protein PUD22_10320, partial [Erysipelotrichaceae bacterium]|nr:hypothetical protein [Erysipelotrichaceae bacterium]
HLAYETLKGKGYELLALTSNFSHVKKDYRFEVVADFTAIETRSYKKNLSIARMASHRKFAKDAFRMIEDYDPDLIYCLAPANSLIKECDAYKKKHPSCKIIIDIIDMWPESLPLSFLRKTPPAKLWQKLRKDHLSCAEKVIAECAYYLDVLRKEYPGDIKVIYWCKDEGIYQTGTINDDKLRLCYLGSINNIIDIELIRRTIEKSQKAVEVHIIGDGERREEMIKSLKEVAEVQYHGLVYDGERKREIMGNCHAGINIYKEGLYIGLTSKCIDYFQYGLPLINNIRSDTYDFINNCNVGVNIDNNCHFDVEKLIALRNNNQPIYDFYLSHFTKEVFKKELNAIIEEVQG